MKLSPKLISDWPKLAWVARFKRGGDEIEVYHGPMVETSDQWIAEAVWTGEFESGDFDRTDIVCGSGIRCRENKVVFVSPSTPMDRQWYCMKNGMWYVSNSLPALVACACLVLKEDSLYANSRSGSTRTTWGLKPPVRSFSTQDGEVNLFWCDNLVFDGQEIRTVPKPDSAPHFRTFDDYYNFLVESAQGLKNNLDSPARHHKVTTVASISSGYDSPAAAVIAKHAGCNQTVTIKQSTSMWRGSDCGAEIAQHLGMSCRSYNRTAKDFPNETAFWAGSGYSHLVNWTLFDYPESLCLFFQGNYGDSIWSRKKCPLPFVIEIMNDLGVDEFRLHVGMFQCIVPFWGSKRAEEISNITLSPEMEPWTLHTDYDRPIPRRIIEQAGIPRGTFAVMKKDTSHASVFRWPYSPQQHGGFAQFLKDRGRYAPASWLVSLIRRISHIDGLFYRNISRKLGLKKGRRPWDDLSSPSLIFLWANTELRDKYKRALEETVPEFHESKKVYEGSDG